MTIDVQITNALRESKVGMRSADIAMAIKRLKPSVRRTLASMYDRGLVNRQTVERGRFLYKPTIGGR